MPFMQKAAARLGLLVLKVLWDHRVKLELKVLLDL
jgi:hypothetical protein